MSAYSELLDQCRRRGWRVRLDGSYPQDNRAAAGFVVDTLEVSSHLHAPLASVPAFAGNLDTAAVDAARALDRQGLIQ